MKQFEICVSLVRMEDYDAICDSHRSMGRKDDPIVSDVSGRLSSRILPIYHVTVSHRQACAHVHVAIK